jgi:hypothetical protein
MAMLHLLRNPLTGSSHERKTFLICNFEKKMMDSRHQQPSIFAQMVDVLRNKSEEELKLLYIRFFATDLKEEWKAITAPADFKDAGEEDIIKAIQQNRYNA